MAGGKAESDYVTNQTMLWPYVNPEDLPSCWNPRDVHSKIELGSDNLKASYIGPGKTDTDAAAVRANHPVPSACGVYYFEVYVVSKGRDGYIGVGLSDKNVKLDRLPGWEKNSFGYHGDDGHSFKSSGTGQAYGSTYTTGDTVGCCINFVDNICFYTKNGVHQGVAFTGIKGTLYPTVGMRTPKEVLLVNFGKKPFLFDIDAYMQEVKSGIMTAVRNVSLADCQSMLSGQQGDVSASDASGTGNEALAALLPHSLNNIVASYLVHHGCAQTAKVFAKDAKVKIKEDFVSIENRKAIRDHILAGEPDLALDLTMTNFKGLLEANPKLLFNIKRQKFIELVAHNHESLPVIIQFGKQLLAECPPDPILKDSLKEVFGLLAYNDPHNSEMAYLLEQSQREVIAEDLNSCILELQHLPKRPDLDTLVRQAGVCLQTGREHGIGAASFVSLDAIITSPSPDNL